MNNNIETIRKMFPIEMEELDRYIKQLESTINEAIQYNKELCELYDCGMELSNAQTNLTILMGKKDLTNYLNGEENENNIK